MSVRNESTMTTDIRVRAKKSLGQNFLVNEGVLDRIVAAADVRPDDTIIEIGPGTGALTGRLAASGARVVAIEKDRRLIDPLKEQFISHPNVTITEGDVLEWQPGLPAGSYKVVANIPYYLTSHLIRQMLEVWPSPSVAVLMVQEEVAERMMAAPPNMNLLALSVQLYAKPSRIMRVSRGSFRPMPDVDSAVVRLDIPTTGDAHQREVLSIARRAFAHKRKQLGSLIPEQALASVGLTRTARPQELSLDQWKQLAAALP